MSDVQIAPGWYDDPTRADGLRWFDGQAWTEHVSARPEPAAAAERDSPASPASTRFEADAGSPGVETSPSTAAGWYADPARPDQWRWFDGLAWTDHVSVPSTAVPVASAPAYGAVQPVAPGYRTTLAVAPAPAAASPYAGAYGAPAYTTAISPAYGATGWSSPPKRRGTTPLRLLVIVVATFAGLWGVAAAVGIVSAGLRSAGQPSYAPGARFHLVDKPPTTLAGLPMSDDSRVVAAAEKLRTGDDASMAQLKGARPTRVQGYAVVGDRLLILAWIRIDQAVDQKTLARGLRDGMVQGGATDATIEPLADGSTMVCARVPTGVEGVKGSGCIWVRSGTGVVELIEAGVGDPATLGQVTQQTAAQMSAPA